MDKLPILTLIAFAPLLGALVLLFVPKQQGRLIKTIALLATLIPLALSAWLFGAYQTAGDPLQFKEVYNWIKIPLNKEFLNTVTSFFFEFKYNLAVDGLSLPLVFLTALVSTMAALASFHIKKRWKTFYILFLLLETGMFGVFMAQDLFLFFLFFEITLVPMFFLIGIWGYLDREKAANKFLIYNGIGSAIMLIAFLIIVATAGFTLTQTNNEVIVSYSGDIHQIAHNLFQDPGAFVNQNPSNGNQNPFFMSDTMKWTLFLMLLVAFGIKLPIFPFHTWMLRVHTEAPPAVVMIHSGILLKMGAYGLIRFGMLFFPAQAKEAALLLGILGVINIVYGAVLAFVQKEFKLVLAYSSISHMGVVLLGLAAFNVAGLQGAVFQLVSHGLISALMFLLVGSIYERTQTTQLGSVGGLAKSVPFISGILLIAGMASLGLPGLSGFIGEFLAFIGIFGTYKSVAVVGALGIVLAAVYVLRGVLSITFGPTVPQHEGMRDARLVEAIPMITLVAFILLLGIYPSVLSEPLQQTINGMDQLLHSAAGKLGG